MSVSIVNTLPETHWRAFIENHPDSNIYHTPELFTVFSGVKSHKPTVWAAIEHERPLALLLPVNLTLINGLFRPLTTRAVSYGSVLSQPGPDGQAALNSLLEHYAHRAGRGVLFTELRNVSNLAYAQPTLQSGNFVYENHLNFLLDLSQTEENLWRNVTKSGQQSIRTARNKGVAVETLNDRVQLPEVYRLLQLVYARAQVPLASAALFESAWDVLVPRGMLKVFVARAAGAAICGALFLAWRDRVIYWYGGLNREFAAYAPMETLLWHAIRWARESGYAIFDFGGAGRPEEAYGPRKFKAKFGGELVELGRNVHIPSRFRLRASEWSYQLLRRFL
ncbi:MAG: lipid II:glycine glycyltransferase FemX [Anaerolineales bacterium]